MLNDDYKRVATIADAAAEHSSQAAPSATVHAQWLKPAQGKAGQTLCGIDSLNFATMSRHRIVSCAACQAELKKERQRRSREGTANYQARMSAQREQVESATAGYEKAESIGPDVVWVPTEEIDRLLVNTLKMRAESLRHEGAESLAADLEITAGRLAEHAQIPDNTSVPQASTDALSTHSECEICADTGRAFGNRCTCPAGQALERRVRPRMIEPTIPTDNEEL